MTIKIGKEDQLQISRRVLKEQETRKKLLSLAREEGFEKELLILFAKYDKLLRLCTNEKERHDIGQLGAVEMHRLLGGGGHLVVDGKLVIEDKDLTLAELIKSEKKGQDE